MVELAGIPPFGGGGVNVRPNSEPAAQTVPAVEASVAGQSLSGRMSSGQSQTDSGTGRQPDQRALAPQKKPVDRDALPGPPPTFQISLLEMDRDLAETLARMNAAHAIERDAAAISGKLEEKQAKAPAEKTDALENLPSKPTSEPDSEPQKTDVALKVAEDHSAA